jgi:hypothetical protein
MIAESGSPAEASSGTNVRRGVDEGDADHPADRTGTAPFGSVGKLEARDPGQ